MLYKIIFYICLLNFKNYNYEKNIYCSNAYSWYNVCICFIYVPFRTSCGRVVQVETNSSVSNSALELILSQINYVQCGVYPQKITIFY